MVVPINMLVREAGMAIKPSQYRVVVKPSLERAEVISTALEAPEYYNKFHYFKGAEHNLPVVTVPIDLLMYRIANARTKDEQLSSVAQGRYNSTFFSTSKQEDVDVQQAQHEFLFGFAQQGQGESVVAIYGELEKKKKQTEPILITTRGVIVNGNRRVSAMRELVQYQGNGSFNHISCMVLPASATEADLIEIEFKLQMAPETRLPYTWTNEARICKQLRDSGKSIEYIADIKDEDPKRIEKLIQMYEVAERYLDEWIVSPGAFNKLEGTRQAFYQMVTRRQSKRPAQEKEVAQAFDFFVVENRENLEDRAYEFINAIESDPGKFAESYADNTGLQLVDLTSPAELQVGENLLIDLGIENEPAQKNLLGVIDHLKEIRTNKEKREAALQTVEAVCELLAAQRKNSGEVALNFARQALKKLSNVDPATAHPKTIPELTSILEKIDERVQSLLNKIAK